MHMIFLVLLTFDKEFKNESKNGIFASTELKTTIFPLLNLRKGLEIDTN